MQITPDVWARKKAILSAVANSAAMMRVTFRFRDRGRRRRQRSRPPDCGDGIVHIAKAITGHPLFSTAREESFDVLRMRSTSDVDPIARALAPKVVSEAVCGK